MRAIGPNKIEEKKPGFFAKFFKWLISPISLMLLAAAGLSFFSGKIFDFYFILFLMALNFFVSFWQEKKADNAIQKLQETLLVKVKVMRDGAWTTLDSAFLVPGDVIQIGVGNIIPADIRILSASNLFINEAALTGESLPQEKLPKDNVYSGAFVVTGMAEAEVQATGKNTYFNKTLLMVDNVAQRSLLEQDILRIAKFLSILSLVAVVILTAVFMLTKASFLDTLTLDLSLVIAGIPISLPTVITLIISLGIVALTKKGAVVRRLSSLQDLANVDLLFTDKTGTLTKNEITVHGVKAYDANEEKVILYALLAEAEDKDNPITRAISKKADELKLEAGTYETLNFIPADSTRKRSSASVESKSDGKIFISSGAPQIIEKFCALDEERKKRFEKDIEEAAQAGYRSLAVAINTKDNVEKDMQLVGLVMLSDTLRKEAKSVIRFLDENGVDVRMLTGDHKAIGERVGKELGLAPEQIFSEILPEDKYNFVNAAKGKHIVAVTGDGVNDLPAVKSADVGIAVSNAVDALKSSADIVLLLSSISVIKDAIIEARKIFARVYSYSVYRISESFRLIITIAVLGLIYHDYPLLPIQLILLALLNDIPIISLAYDRVKVATKPAKINVRERFILSTLFGLTGVANSLILFFIMLHWTHLSWDMIQTIFFLKLAISGHLLIYVAHTKERWWKFLPSRQVILATLGTQAVATVLALTGTFVSKVPIEWVIIVWIWSFFWMQVSEVTKVLADRIFKKRDADEVALASVLANPGK